MQRKSVKTILFGLILGIPATYAATTDSNITNSNISLSPIQPGFYYSVGYTYAMVKNAGMSDLTIHQLPYNPSLAHDDPYILYEDQYAGGSGANVKLSYLWSNHWGIEANMAFVKISQNQAFTGNTNIGNTPVTGNYIRRSSNFFAEALGEYAFSLTPQLALLAKAGAGYEYQNQAFFLNGFVINPDAPQFTSTFQEKDHHFGPATAAELRYAMTQNVSLGFELNDLAAHENIASVNANAVVRF